VSGRASWQRFSLEFQLGYTYTNPINLKPQFPKGIDTTGQSVLVDLQRFLKYRYRHLLRTDVQLNYGPFKLGANVRYNSVILNIDEDFYLFMPGLVDYRLQSIRGDVLVDLRMGYAVNDNFSLNFIVRNLANRSWMPIPGNIGEQRNFVLQFATRF
jgi:outer membrane receptor protein involved in Fe transport